MSHLISFLVFSLLLSHLNLKGEVFQSFLRSHWISSLVFSNLESHYASVGEVFWSFLAFGRFDQVPPLLIIEYYLMTCLLDLEGYPRVKFRAYLQMIAYWLKNSCLDFEGYP